MSPFTYLFEPNPGQPVMAYANPKVILLLVLCALMIFGAFGIRVWRQRQTNPMTKKLSKSWFVASLWFGIVALLLVISRVEEIQFLAMRLLWVLWVIALALYSYLQVRMFRTRHYEVLPRERVRNARDPYLPGKKRK